MMTNLLSNTKGASQALTHHSGQSLVIALSSCLLKQLSSVELLSKQVLFLHIVCSRPVWAGKLGNPNPVLNVHELYLPPCYCPICPPEAHQPPSLGQLLPTYPPEVCLTPSLGPFTCLHGSLMCAPAVLWHHPLTWLEVTLWLMTAARASSICWVQPLMHSMAADSDQLWELGWS